VLDVVVIDPLELPVLAVVIPPVPAIMPPVPAVVPPVPLIEDPVEAPVPVAGPQMPLGHEVPVDVFPLSLPPHMVSARAPPTPRAARANRMMVRGMNASC
jgi:hypothetical protein